MLVTVWKGSLGTCRMSQIISQHTDLTSLPMTSELSQEPPAFSVQLDSHPISARCEAWVWDRRGPEARGTPERRTTSTAAATDAAPSTMLLLLPSRLRLRLLLLLLLSHFPISPTTATIATTTTRRHSSFD